MDASSLSEAKSSDASSLSQTSLNSGNSVTEEEPDVPIDHQSSKGVFGWCEINGVLLPTILRQGNKTFLSVRMVELKLMGHVRAEIAKLRVENPVVSHYVTEAECNLLNEINFKHCDKEYGEAAFATQDLIVDKEHFEKFFHYLLDRIRESGGVVPVMTAAAAVAPPPPPPPLVDAAAPPDVKPHVQHHHPAPPPPHHHAAAGVVHHLGHHPAQLQQQHLHQLHQQQQQHLAAQKASYAKQLEAKKAKQQQVQMQKQAQQQRLAQHQREMLLQQQQQARLATPSSSAAALLQQTKQQQQLSAGLTAAQRQLPMTGWIQLNNTMVPYVVRGGAGGEKFLPVEIVCGAAQLLGHVQDRRTISQPASVQELLVLNEACQRERIDFTFSSTTFLVSLALVQKMTKAVGGTLSIVERPSVNPFGHARGATTAPPHSQAQIHQTSIANAFHGQQPNVVPNQPNGHRPPMDLNSQRPRFQPMISGIQSAAQQRPAKDVVTTATIRQSLSAVLQQQTNGLLSKTNIPWGRQTTNPFGMSPTNSSHPFLQQQQMSPGGASRAPNNPFGAPVVLFKVSNIADKEILFAVTNAIPDGVALVHDISQRLFPHADEDELIYAMTSVLRVPLLDLTPDISAAFASRNPQFLPPKAKTHKLIRKSVLDEFYLRLSYMFPTVTSNSAPDAAAASAAASRSAASSLSQPNLSKQPTMTLKQIAQQLNAHAASVGVNPQNGSLGSISSGSASAVLRKHIEAQKSAVGSPNHVPNPQQHPNASSVFNPQHPNTSLVFNPLHHIPPPVFSPHHHHHHHHHHQQTSSTPSSESLVKTEKVDAGRLEKPAHNADPIILSDSEDEEAQPSSGAASDKIATTTTTSNGPVASQPANASSSASSMLNMSDTDNGVDLWKESAEDEAAVNFVLAENPEIVQDDVLKLAFALSPPPPPPPTPPASEPDLLPSSSADIYSNAGDDKGYGSSGAASTIHSVGGGKKLPKTTTYGKTIEPKAKGGEPNVKKKRGRKPKKEKEKVASKHGVDPDAEYAKLVQMEEANVFEDSSSSSSSTPSSDNDEEWSPGKKQKNDKKKKRVRIRQTDTTDDDEHDERKDDGDGDDDDVDEIVKKKTKRRLKIKDDDGESDVENDDDGEKRRRRKNESEGKQIDDDDAVVDKWRKRAKPGYMDEFLMDGDESDASSASSASSSSSSSDWGEMGLTLLDERDRQRLSSAGSQERRRATSGADSSSQDVNYSGSSRVTFGPDHWSALASVDARLEERRKLAELYRRYEASCQLKPCRVKLKRVAIQKLKSRRRGRPSKLTTAGKGKTTTTKPTKSAKSKHAKENKQKDGERRKRPLVTTGGTKIPSWSPAEPPSVQNHDCASNGHETNEFSKRGEEDEDELLLVQKGDDASLTRLTIVKKSSLKCDGED